MSAGISCVGRTRLNNLAGLACSTCHLTVYWLGGLVWPACRMFLTPALGALQGGVSGLGIKDCLQYLPPRSVHVRVFISHLLMTEHMGQKNIFSHVNWVYFYLIIALTV